LWLSVNNYNQQTLKNNLKQKLTPKNKTHRKNPIGKATTTTKQKISINQKYHLAFSQSKKNQK
jgi:hypothetical protein